MKISPPNPSGDPLPFQYPLILSAFSTNPLLVVLAGPTAVGKTDFAIRLAKKYRTEILSADSRQFYQELSIGTAKPSSGQLAEVNHHFVGHLSIHDYYNISRFEQDALALLNQLFRSHRIVVVAGGSGLYIDALCRGVDEFPDPDPALRSYLKGIYRDNGLEAIRQLLLSLDPVYYLEVDINNPNRILRALEVCMATGKPYSGQRNNSVKPRDFRILKIGLNLPRQELFERISRRVDQMISDGLEQEVRSLFSARNLNALNTVGYKELFGVLEGEKTLQQAIEDIKTNTRRYAKRQLTWFRKDPDYHWFSPEAFEEITKLIDSVINESSQPEDGK